MLKIRPANERGVTNWGWLDSRHTFSFANYHDPAHIRFRSLRVINDDRIEAGGGFPMHPHRDMEIISIVVSGALEHRDSLGNGSVIRPTDVQRMTAGTGIMHSEFNPSDSEATHLMQIWIMPDKQGLTPSYEQIAFPDDARHGRLCLVASKDGSEGSVTINQDADVYATRLSPGEGVSQPIGKGRGVWVQVATGSISVNGQRLDEGDGAAITEEDCLEIQGVTDAEALVFDLG